MQGNGKQTSAQYAMQCYHGAGTQETDKSVEWTGSVQTGSFKLRIYADSACCVHVFRCRHVASSGKPFSVVAIKICRGEEDSEIQW